MALPRPALPEPGPLSEDAIDLHPPEPGADPDAALRAEEAEVVRRVVAGDRDAFGTLVARYGRRVHDLALRMLRDPVEAEDVAQQAFLNAYRALGRFDGRRPFRHWLLRIATNLCRNRWVERRRRALSLAGPGDDDDGDLRIDPPAPTSTSGEEIDERADADRLRAAIERLPEPYRLAVVLRYTQQMSVDEVSEITEVPVATVKTHLHRARAALRRLLEGETSAPPAGTEGQP